MTECLYSVSYTHLDVYKRQPMEVFGEFIKECGTQNGWSDATYEKFAAVRKHLEK